MKMVVHMLPSSMEALSPSFLLCVSKNPKKWLQFWAPPSNNKALVFLSSSPPFILNLRAENGLRWICYLIGRGAIKDMVMAWWRKILGRSRRDEEKWRKKFVHRTPTKSLIFVLIWHFGLILWCEGTRDGSWVCVGTRDGFRVCESAYYAIFLTDLLQ